MKTETLVYQEEKSGLEVKTIEKVAEARLPTEFGEFQIAGYESLTSDEEFIALFKGEFDENTPVPVRIHSQCLTGDVFHSLKCDCGKQLRWAMQRIANEGRGIIVYQYQEGRGIGIINKIRAYALQDKGADTIEANLMLGFDVDLRRYEQCVEIIKDLGAKRVKVMSNNPQKIKAIIEGGLEIVERIPIEFKPSKDSINYLKVKKLQMGHLLDLVG
jgi:GTP cyclohydrolase II